MHDLVAITPLGGDKPRVDRVGPVTLSERPDWALASVASRLGREQDCRDGLKAALGQGVPDVGRLAAGDPLSAFWTGPEQWMVEAPHASHEDLAARLKAALGDAASVTEQTDGWCRFDMEGDGVVAVLERLCNVDVAAQDSGAATRASIEHLGCFLVCRAARRSLSVIGPRSSAGSLHHALLTAMRSAL
ncbi:sarcosine oxidase subunit gamma [Sedimentitalea sp. JM2-8]|uniref:Sarcosine oxidase subunit gamma n=1 Tax=Sedimentitalea xiamensis TaxID=3050037 RepID=A0ABT7FF81_9RHOB|nr:sarcosine oxidase subunit gamma [Sedimentitalea xiamensis]MDK3073469.1 sarcosine oxidase subunit gamma [Sedimentitalea xiamensis]